jgi:macrodomain Ter protein organizer (MatP/YcbG family)
MYNSTRYDLLKQNITENVVVFLQNKATNQKEGYTLTNSHTTYMYEIAEKNSTTNKVQSINTDIYSIF